MEISKENLYVDTGANKELTVYNNSHLRNSGNCSDVHFVLAWFHKGNIVVSTVAFSIANIKGKRWMNWGGLHLCCNIEGLLLFLRFRIIQKSFLVFFGNFICPVSYAVYNDVIVTREKWKSDVSVELLNLFILMSKTSEFITIKVAESWGRNILVHSAVPYWSVVRFSTP